MDRINIMLLLQYVDDYVLIKKDEVFPQYMPGSDIDLVVFDREETIRSIYSFYESHIGEIGEMKVSDKEKSCHIDFLFDGKLNLRVDLIDNFEFFEKIDVKPSFIFKLFKDRQLVECNDGHVYVPADEDDLTLRYFEYLEWFDHRPDKIKHLDYICEVEDEALKKRFFANTHRFIQFKRKTWRSIVRQPQSRREALKMIKLGCRHLISVTARRWISRISMSS